MLLKNNSQQQNDDFILDCLFAIILIAVFIFCFCKRKKIYKYITEIETYNNLPNFRLYLGILGVTIGCIIFLYKFLSEIFA